LTSEDFEFIAKLAWKANQDQNSEQIVAISQVLECYMIRRSYQYRNMADRIFVQLVQGKCSELYQVQTYLKQHLATAIAELAEADREMDLFKEQLKKAKKNTTSQGLAEAKEVEMQIRFLGTHILGLANGLKIFSTNFL